MTSPDERRDRTRDPRSGAFSRRTGLVAGFAALGAGLGAALAGCTTPAPAAPPATPASGATPTPTPRPTATVRPPAPLPWAGVRDPLPAGAVNVLIYGTDNDTDSGNTDVLVVAQLSADRTHVTLVGIPRDSYVALASGGHNKVNAELLIAGPDALRRTVSDLFGGLRLHYMAQTNFHDFIGLCRLLAGFGVVNRIASSVTSQVTGRVTRFPARQLVLNGADWLIYARQRHGLPEGEFDRGERHRAIVTGTTKLLQYLAGKQPARLAAIAKGVFQWVRVTGGITPANILGLVPALLKVTSFTSLRVPNAGFGSHGSITDTVELNGGQLAALGAALRNGSIAPYVKQYGQG